MRIEHLEEFIDLSETLNFTRTAKRFYITQPVLSKHIATLERELEGQLLDRSRREVKLSAFGQALLPLAKTLINDKERLFQEANHFKSGEKAPVRVGFLQGAAGQHIPEIQRRFGAAHPEVKVEYLTYEFDKIFDSLDNGSMDIIIGGLTLSLSDDIFAVNPVYKDTYYALVNADDNLAQLRTIAPSDLRGKTVVIPAPSFFSRDIEVLSSWLEPEKNRISILESVHDINTAPLSVKINNAVSLTFGHLSSFYGAEYELIPLADFDVVLNIAVIWRRTAERPFFSSFAQITRKVIEEYGY